MHYLKAVDPSRVAQIHIAGHATFANCLLDTHDQPVIDPVWELYEYAIGRIGPTATLLEWDDRIPSFEEVHAEARKAEKISRGPGNGEPMNLLQLQRTMARDIMRPPRTGGACARTADWLKPNDRLSARARLNIYHRQYWRRLLECLAEDFPALRALVGDRAFQRISGAYLTDCPSRSFTLRDLGSGLQAWLQAHPGCCGSLRGRALDAPADDIAALEWAEVEAFDSAVHREIGPEHFAELDPNLRIGLQPYIRLLKLSYPADEMRSSLLASTSQRRRALISRIDSANAEGIFLAVYRSEDEGVLPTVGTG